MKVEVSAVPFPGFDSFRRAGRRWSEEPKLVSVVPADPGESSMAEDERDQLLKMRVAADEITSDDLALLEAAKNIKVRYVDMAPRAAPPARAAPPPSAQPPAPPAPAAPSPLKDEKPAGPAPKDEKPKG